VKFPGSVVDQIRTPIPRGTKIANLVGQPHVILIRKRDPFTASETNRTFEVLHNPQTPIVSKEPNPGVCLRERLEQGNCAVGRGVIHGNDLVNSFLDDERLHLLGQKRRAVTGAKDDGNRPHESSGNEGGEPAKTRTLPECCGKVSLEGFGVTGD
jgi:hypothetical protein